MRESEHEILSFSKYYYIILRHKLLLFLSIVLMGVLGTLYAFSLPELYKSTTLILVEAQKIPETYVRTTVASNAGDRLSTLNKQVMSRTRLQRIIDEFGLYKTKDKKPLGTFKVFNNILKLFLEKYPNVFRELKLENFLKRKKSKSEIIETIRENIEIDMKRYGRGQNNYFSINYIGKDPKTVMDVTNKLASLYIEENLKIREMQVVGTSVFLKNELNNIKIKLEESEEAISKFKKLHLGELPEQLQANLRIMDQLQLRFQTIGESIRGVQDRKMIIQKRLDEAKKNFLTTGTINSQGNLTTDTEQKSENEMQLESLKILLSNLKTKYTDQYPDIGQLKKNIERIKKKVNLEKQIKINGNREKEHNSREKTTPTLNIEHPLLESIQNDLASINIELLSLERDRAKIKKQLTIYQLRVEGTPKREQQLITLTRNYDIMIANYQSLLEKKLQANLSENLERRQKGEQFRILDPANFPEKPFKPNRPMLILGSIIAGFGLGAMLIYLVEFFDTTFYHVDDVENFINLPVLTSIPKIK